MPSYELEYPKEPFSTVKRYNTRANYALETIHGIVNSAQLLHVSFNVPNSPFPMILPLIGQMGSFARPSADLGDVLDLYLHGYVSSRIMNLSRDQHPSATAAAAGVAAAGPGAEGEGGLPVCVAASHVDGLVLALTPNAHSYNYRSAVLFGHAAVVTDVAEKLFAMELITDGVVPARWSHTRVPPNGAEMQSTSVLKVTICNGSAKIRTGMPHDEKHDVQDEGIVGRVWSGVVPVYPTVGEPLPGPYNRVEQPAYLAEFRKDFNDVAKEQALSAAVEVVDNKKESE